MNNVRIIVGGIVLVGMGMLVTGVYLLTRPDTPQQPVVEPKNTPANTPVPVKTSVSKLITVPAKSQWYDTGIDIKAQDSFRIIYKGGQWTNVVGSNFVDGNGKGGFDRRNQLLVPSSHLASLVGRVGSTAFHTGNEYRGFGKSGRLYLSINDIPNTYNDNEGELDVLIEVN